MLSNIHSGKLNTQLLSCQAPVSQNSLKIFRARKAFVKLPPAYSVKLEFLYVTKGIKTISTNLLVVYRESVNLIGYITRRLSADSIQL